MSEQSEDLAAVERPPGADTEATGGSIADKCRCNIGFVCQRCRNRESARAISGPGVLLPTNDVHYPPPPERPIVRHGDVAAQLTNELTSLFRHYGALLAFEKKVADAAQSPAAWLALREDVRK